MSKLPIIAAIPNYNMGEQLTELLPQLMTSGYDEIYVLDDASTDHSRDVTASVSGDIRFVGRSENKGAGSNRNQIIGALGHDAIIHFLDADIRLDTERMAEVVADALPSQSFGFVGGMAKTKDGMQTVWNYGPRQSLWSDMGAQVQARLEPLLLSDPTKAAKLKDRFATLTEDWPNPLSEPIRRRVFWTIEQNLVIDSRIFAGMGGFDESLREHGVQDLAIRMAKLGLDRFFDPSFSTTHKAVDVRLYNRLTAMMKAEAKIARKHGLLSWLLPDGHLKPSL